LRYSGELYGFQITYAVVSREFKFIGNEFKNIHKKSGIGWSYENKMLLNKHGKPVIMINDFIYSYIDFIRYICCFFAY